MKALGLAALLFTATPALSAEPLKWAGCDICKASFMEEAVVAFEKKTGIKTTIEEMGDGKGLVALVAKRSHMGGTCRHSLNTPEERGIKLVPVAWDALVITVHPSNPVKDITMEQIRGVYSGKITNWKALGGKDLPLVAVERVGKTSGVGLSARELIFKKADFDYAPSVKLVDSSYVVEDTCQREPGCLAITGISSARLRKGLKILSIEGKEPTKENVARGEYVLYRPLYLTYPAVGADPRVNEFIKFMLSPEGQALLTKTGTVNLKEGKDLWSKYKAGMRGQ